MTPQDFEFVSVMLRRRSGLVLTPDKTYLLTSRLTPLTRKFSLAGTDQVVAALKRGDRAVEDAVVEAMTTNETYFFRDPQVFDQFKAAILPELFKARATTKRLRVWSAASSSGQEAYSIALLLKEEFGKMPGWTSTILGTDISDEMIDRCKNATYTHFEIQRGLPVKYLITSFEDLKGSWRLKPDIRAMVQFRKWNLLDDFGTLGQFDIVFCRNVLIYFDTPMKAKILTGIARIMPDDGVLYLGGAEGVLGVTEAFKPIPNVRGAYRPNRAGLKPGT
ncbi:MAG: CheR family methyltransferase [Rhodospirillaceae bacterium]|nr:CheR family methyltransferase [Rhodospirillaceae bacterium]